VQVSPCRPLVAGALIERSAQRAPKSNHRPARPICLARTSDRPAVGSRRRCIDTGPGESRLATARAGHDRPEEDHAGTL